MNNRYARNFPALTAEEQTVLRGKKVLIVGCGGLGGYLIEFMARVGVGALRCVDGDVFEESNLNRQLLSETELLGSSKSKAAAERLSRINPETAVEAVAEFLTEENADRLVQGCDVVLDGLDNIKSRKILAAACERHGVPYVFGAITGWVYQCALILPGEPLLDIMYPNDDITADKSALSFTPAACAAAQCSLAVRLMTGRKAESSVLHYGNLLTQEFETIPLG